jgi:magnesium-transporting ATPase (P-type)
MSNETAPWHALAVDEIVKQLDTQADQGLTATEASSRLVQHGPNKLPLGKQQSAFMRFLQQFNNVLVYVLLGAGVLKAVLGLWLDAGIILGVVFLNGLLGFFQEGKAVRRGAHPARRRAPPARRRHAGAGRYRAARVG